MEGKFAVDHYLMPLSTFFMKMCTLKSYPCEENQLDSLFIFSLFRQSTSTCFEIN